MSTHAFVKDVTWLDWDPNPSKPRFQVPDGAVDAHCHVFGPGNTFPFAPERKYTPCDASREQLFALRDFLGFKKNVVVQATCHGSDNSALLDVLKHSDDKARGVVTIKPDITEAELARMHELGVRDVRFNYVKRPHIGREGPHRGHQSDQGPSRVGPGQPQAKIPGDGSGSDGHSAAALQAFGSYC